MLNFKLNSMTLGLVLIPAMALMGQAQSLVGGQRAEEPSATQSLPSDQSASLVMAVSGASSPTGTQPQQLGSGSFSGYCLYRTNGARLLTCYSTRINANSRVFAAVSEYSTIPTARFIGSARMRVNNVRPFNGGVQVWADIEWGSALNVRMDILVDP